MLIFHHGWCLAYSDLGKSSPQPVWDHPSESKREIKHFSNNYGFFFHRDSFCLRQILREASNTLQVKGTLTSALENMSCWVASIPSIGNWDDVCMHYWETAQRLPALHPSCLLTPEQGLRVTAIYLYTTSPMETPSSLQPRQLIRLSAPSLTSYHHHSLSTVPFWLGE